MEPFTLSEKKLTKYFIMMRIFVIFIAVPFFRLFLTRFDFVEDREMTFLGRSISQFDVFDSIHFMHVARERYQSEINHAFFPMFPFTVTSIAKLLGTDGFALVGFWLQILLSYANTLLIYRVGKRVFGQGQDNERIAELSSRFYIVSHSAVYQVAFYSENLFLFLTLMGLLIIYSGKTSQGLYLPPCHRIVLATFVFGLATCTRSTGVLMSVFVAFFMLNKMLLRADRFCKLFKYILFSWFAALTMFLPLWVVVYWKPYLLHCETKLERSNEIPPWCLNALPNVYNHIQFVYWDNQLFGMLYRKLDNFLVSIPMNVLFFYFMYRVLASQALSFFSLGLLGRKKETLTDFFGNAQLVPHVWYFAVQLLLVMLFANADINSRVASTCPFYFWAFAAIVHEANHYAKVEASVRWMARLAFVHNFAYMVLNFATFPMEAAFF
jgi:phosphatidylinositol glycan class V